MKGPKQFDPGTRDTGTPQKIRELSGWIVPPSLFIGWLRFAGSPLPPAHLSAVAFVQIPSQQGCKHPQLPRQKRKIARSLRDFYGIGEVAVQGNHEIAVRSADI